MTNKPKANEEWIEGLVKIGKKNKTLLSLSMKTGEYTLSSEAEDLILEALQAKDLEHKEDKQKIIDEMPVDYLEECDACKERGFCGDRDCRIDYGVKIKTEDVRTYQTKLRKQFNLK